MYDFLCTTRYKQEETAVGEKTIYKFKASPPYLQIRRVAHFSALEKYYSHLLWRVLDKFRRKPQRFCTVTPIGSRDERRPLAGNDLCK